MSESWSPLPEYSRRGFALFLRRQLDELPQWKFRRLLESLILSEVPLAEDDPDLGPILVSFGLERFRAMQQGLAARRQWELTKETRLDTHGITEIFDGRFAWRDRTGCFEAVYELCASGESVWLVCGVYEKAKKRGESRMISPVVQDRTIVESWLETLHAYQSKERALPCVEKNGAVRWGAMIDEEGELTGIDREADGAV